MNRCLQLGHLAQHRRARAIRPSSCRLRDLSCRRRCTRRESPTKVLFADLQRIVAVEAARIGDGRCDEIAVGREGGQQPEAVLVVDRADADEIARLDRRA